ncbi:hypothetical protein FRB95_013215 [Tulasnella sp. JGI-2019a]|nr:hypothetical protein FRB95_013215 [Tulasnella sp. JGI-2019a]
MHVGCTPMDELRRHFGGPNVDQLEGYHELEDKDKTLVNVLLHAEGDNAGASHPANSDSTSSSSLSESPPHAEPLPTTAPSAPPSPTIPTANPGPYGSAWDPAAHSMSPYTSPKPVRTVKSPGPFRPSTPAARRGSDNRHSTPDPSRVPESTMRRDFEHGCPTPDIFRSPGLTARGDLFTPSSGTIPTPDNFKYSAFAHQTFNDANPTTEYFGRSELITRRTSDSRSPAMDISGKLKSTPSRALGNRNLPSDAFGAPASPARRVFNVSSVPLTRSNSTSAFVSSATRASSRSPEISRRTKHIPDTSISGSRDNERPAPDVFGSSATSTRETYGKPLDSTSPEKLKDLGDIHFRNESYESAINYYGQAIGLQPNPMFYSNRASAYIALKRFKPALDDCHTALLPASKTLGSLAKCHLAMGNPEAALRTVQVAMECDASSQRDWFLSIKSTAELMQEHLGICHDAWRRKCWLEAEHSLKAAMELCDGDCPPQWCIWEMKIATGRSDWDIASALAGRAEHLHPTSADVHAASAHVALITNHLLPALRSLESALQLDRAHPRAGELLRRLRSIDRAKKEGDRLYDTAAYFLASGKYKEALDELGFVEEDSQGSPLRAYLLNKRARSFMQIKHFELARDDCEAALSIPNHPLRFAAMSDLANCHMALGDLAAAFLQVHEALKLYPRDDSFLAMESTLKKVQIDLEASRDAWASHEWYKAKSALARVMVEWQGDYPLEWWIWKVEADIATRNWEDAITTARTAAQLHFASPRVLVNLGLALMFSNRVAECIKHLQSALRYDPEHSFATSTLYRAQEIERLQNAGDEALQSRKYSEAVEKYTATLTTIASHDEEGGGGYLRAALLANRATALMKLEKYSQALADLDDSLKLNASAYVALCTRGRIHMIQGYYAEAITTYTRARELWIRGDNDPGDGQAIVQDLRRAEAALKTSQSKDYHGILGIPRDATEDVIKKAYKMESQLSHPDNGGNPEHFKLVSEAYTALLSQSFGTRSLLCQRDAD